MAFQMLLIDNNDMYQEKIYDIIKTNSKEGLQNQLSPLISKINTSKDMLIADVYKNLDITHDSITFYIKTTTVFQNDKYLLQIMHVSDNDIYDGGYYKLDKYKFNYLGKLIINADDNVNGKFIIFAYKINKDYTYEFCDMTEELFLNVIKSNLFKKIIYIDIDEYSQLYMDNEFNIYDKNYKSMNININKNELIEYSEKYVANFRLGIITFKKDEDEYNSILHKLLGKFEYKGDYAYIFSYYNDKDLTDNLSIEVFKKLLNRNKNNKYIIPEHKTEEYIYNKFNMLEFEK